MKAGKGAVVRCVDHGQRLAGIVGKELFHHEGRGDLPALVKVFVGDKAVELGPQGHGLDQSRQDHMEQGVGKIRGLGVFLRQKGVYRPQIDVLRDIGLVVAAVGIDQRCDEVHPVQIPDERPVLPVAKAAFFLFHAFSPNSAPRGFSVLLMSSVSDCSTRVKVRSSSGLKRSFSDRTARASAPSLSVQ